MVSNWVALVDHSVVNGLALYSNDFDGHEYDSCALDLQSVVDVLALNEAEMAVVCLGRTAVYFGKFEFY